MEVLSPMSVGLKEEYVGRVISHVPELLKKRKWGAMDLFRELTKLDEKIGQQTCYRLAEGGTDFTIQTLAKLCKVFGVPVGKVVELVEDEQPG